MSIETEPGPISDDQFKSESPDETEKPKRRFVLGKEPFARERIEAIKSAVEELQTENPEILGLTLFGSTVKGRHTKASDIDGFLFVDADLAEEKYKEPIYNWKERSEFIIWMTEAYSHLYKELSVIGSYDIRVKTHVMPLPINEEIIDKEVEILVKKDNLLPRQNLTGMFHLMAGHGIEKYRKYLVEKLAGMGELGEGVWHRIIDETEKWEEGNTREFGEKKYPRTLEEAKKLYL